MGSMKIYYDWAKDIMRKEPGTITALEANLLSGLRRGAEEHWWPSLRTLNTAKRRCEARNEDFVKFGTLWKGFGALLGCDIRRERERDALDAAGRCTRLECEYHRTPTGQQLLRCKGCGVYYCSRECQRLEERA
ncbi:hypothetical protein PENSPDRAFT_147944 [Peniophora sp. CONT]|nr:hypothetical protein PENSPDRAFT_147944 [Peniophora sp. CONT]